MQSRSKEPSTVKPTCPDCAMCQGCSESRCRTCRPGERPTSARKLSIREQIELYDRLNSSLAEERDACLDRGGKCELP